MLQPCKELYVRILANSVSDCRRGTSHSYVDVGKGGAIGYRRAVVTLLSCRLPIRFFEQFSIAGLGSGERTDTRQVRNFRHPLLRETTAFQ